MFKLKSKTGIIKAKYHNVILKAYITVKGLTDKGQLQYLIKLKGPQEGNYLYTTQFLSLR